MPSVLLTHAPRDLSAARRIAARLEAQGAVVWLDDGDPALGHRHEVAVERLSQADVVLALWSPDGVASPWVTGAARLARDAGKLVGVGLEGHPPPHGLGGPQATVRRLVDALDGGDELVRVTLAVADRAPWRPLPSAAPEPAGLGLDRLAPFLLGLMAPAPLLLGTLAGVARLVAELGDGVGLLCTLVAVLGYALVAGALTGALIRRRRRSP